MVGVVGRMRLADLLAGLSDELAMNAAAARTNFADPRDLFATFLPRLTWGMGPVQRARVTAAALMRGNNLGPGYVERHRAATTPALKPSPTSVKPLRMILESNRRDTR
jgi:hypothetical protein